MIAKTDKVTTVFTMRRITDIPIFWTDSKSKASDMIKASMAQLVYTSLQKEVSIM